VGKKTDHPESPAFEAAMRDLESLVEALESGDLSLEESLKQFEQGMALTRSCQEALVAAEQRVQQLISKDGSERLEPFDDSAQA
jgi:exodeoxyribonuclease VII small subunit